MSNLRATEAARNLIWPHVIHQDAAKITQELVDTLTPIIAAQALRDAAKELEPYGGVRRRINDEFRDGIDYVQEALTDRADEIDPH